MDIQRPASVAQAKKRRQYMFGAVGILVIVLVSVVLARLKPAAPTVERATVWVDTVKRGQMLRQRGQRDAAGIHADRDALLAARIEKLHHVEQQRRRQVVDAVVAAVFQDVERDALARARKAADQN